MTTDRPLRIPCLGADGKPRDLPEYAMDQFAEELEVAANRLNAQILKWYHDPATRERDITFRMDDLLHAQLAWLIGHRAGKDNIFLRWQLRSLFCEWNIDTCGHNIVQALKWGATADDVVNDTRVNFLDRWFEHNCPVVRIDERTTAGMAFTSVPPDIEDEEIKMPWQAFKIMLPIGLVPSTKKNAFYERIEIHHESRPIARWFISAIDETGHIDQIVRGSFAELIRPRDWRVLEANRGRELVKLGKVITEEDEDAFFDLLENAHVPMSKEQRTLSLLIGRIVSGCIFFMTEPGNLRRRIDRTKPKWRQVQRDKEPHTTEYQLAPPAQIKFPNAVDAVRAMLSLAAGRSTGRNVQLLQWMVRGHWRRQACGALLENRKWIWVTPYWKGPERAKRIIREKNVTARD